MSTASDIASAQAALAAVIQDSQAWSAMASALNVSRYTDNVAAAEVAQSVDAAAVANSAALAATANAALAALVLDA